MARSLLPAVLLALLAAGIFLTRPPDADTGDASLHVLSGQTMGTSYRVLVHAGAVSGTEQQSLRQAVAQRLAFLDRGLFSTYAGDSSLTVLNATPPGTAVPVAGEMLDVLAAAAEVHERSGGAFDITVKPLVDLWGFGPGEPPAGIPAEEDIERALALTGAGKVHIDADAGTVTRTGPVLMDLSAIAKGYAVDQVAALLEAEGLEDYLVEIGGEIVARGRRPGGTPWRVGIETPEAGARTAFRQIPAGPEKMAVAASGNYRNFFMVDGKRYAHTIDPVTGWPVSHDLVSVTVVADSAMRADAWATALLVLGPGEGMKLANDLQLAAYFIVTGSTGFSARHSDAFSRYLEAIQ